MKTIIRILFFLLFGFLTAKSTVQAATTDRYVNKVFTAVDITNDVSYTATQKLDIYQPHGDTLAKRPVLVFIHAGGFVGGDKANATLVQNAQDLAKYGYVFIPINYHLGDTSGLFIGYTQWPPNFQPSATALQNMKEAQADAESAILWVRSHASEYRLDPNKVVLMGASAGALTALYTGHLTTSRIHPPNVVVSDMGAVLPLDLPRITAKGPPTIFFHGTADTTMPFLSARLTYERLRSVGTVAQWHEFAGVAHAINIEGSLTKLFLLQFLADQLQLNTTPTLTPAPTPTPIPGDYTDSGDVPGDQVNIFDYNLVITSFGNPYTIFDYNNVVQNFGL